MKEDDDKLEVRELESHSYSSQFGRSTEYVTCPFCGTDVLTFVWSRHGSGKRCGCGALLGGYIALKERST